MQKEINFIQMSHEDYVRGLVSLSKNLRVQFEGGTLNFKPFLKLLRQANTQTGGKKKCGEGLSEHEKWLYDNAYLLKRASQKYSAKELPLLAKDGELRIVSILRYALYHHKNLKKEDIIDTLRIVNSETTLTFDEVRALPRALSYVLCEGLSVIASRVLYHNKMKFLAEKEVINQKYFISDIYNYYLLKSSAEREVTREILVEHGVNVQGIESAYTLTTMENDEVARTFLTYLQNVEEFAELSATVPTLETYKTLSSVKGFKKMSFDTELYYLSFVQNIARHESMSEALVAEKLVFFAQKTDFEISEVVFYKQKAFRNFLKNDKISNKKFKEVAWKEHIYFGFILTLSALFAAISCYLLQNLLAILLILPFYFVCECITNRALHASQKHRFLPRMSYPDIPMNCKTLVAISEFVVSRQQLEAAVRHMEVLQAGNGGENVEFALLIDLKPAETEEAESDADLLNFLKESLKNKPQLNAFVRKRVQSGAKYLGRERKRGAIEDMNFMLSSGNREAFRLVLKDFATPQYVVLLDSDNTLEPGAILDMVNLISHPANERYDLLTATGRYRLSDERTAYSERFQALGGLESYPHYSSFFFDLFGKDVFCGKGIYRIKAYEKKIAGIFPEKRILSHDILEGAVLNTASGGVVYEDAPETFLQEEERVTRWQRGDIQLLPFIFGGWKNENGEKYRSEIPFFYRALVVRNALQPLSATFLFLALVLGLFLDKNIAILSIIVSFLPFLIDLIGEFRTLFDGRRMRYVLKSIANAFVLQFEKFALLPYRALKNAYIFCATLVKMVAKKNLLEWKTFYMSRTEHDGAKFSQMVAVPLVFCTIILMLLFFVAGAQEVVLFACFSALTPLILAFLFLLSQKSTKKSDKNHDFLLSIAEKTFRYFDFIRSNNMLAPDNFQQKPFKGRATATSPTNLGYAFVADICAYHLGFRSLEETIKNLSAQILSIEKLKKWKGNLFNWYSLTGDALNKFVSGVDSGNFLACLVVLQGFLEEESQLELCARVAKLIDETNISALYDKEKKLFYLGYDAKSRKYTGHYDMLMSESRLTSYLQVARSKDSALWRNLSRDYTGYCGNTLLSWSGTMFEYLMPSLFLRAPKGSLIANSEKNAIKIQSKSRFNGVWGRSEGGYHAFDNEMNYRYYAIGEEKLSLRIEPNRAVVSPYSSVLAVSFLKNKAIKNLKRLKKLGMLGEYGFYEGVDFSDGKKNIVESYMTHHQGMILAALTNALEGDILVHYMRKNPLCESAELILTERSSEKYFSKKNTKIKPIIAKSATEYYRKTSNQEYYEQLFALTNGKVSVMYDNLGNNQTAFNNILLGKPYRAERECVGGFFYVLEKGICHTPTVFPLEDGCQYESGQTENTLFFRNLSAGILLEVIKNDNFEAVTKRLTVSAPTGKQMTIAYIEDLVMNDADAFLSHPVYNGMFVATSYLAERKTIIAEKRSGEEDGDRFMACVIKGMDKIFVETDRNELIGRGNSLKNPKILHQATIFQQTEMLEEADVGDVLEPALGFCGVTELSRNGACVVELTEVFAPTKEELLKLLDTMPHNFFAYAQKSPSENFFAQEFNSMLLSNLCFGRRNTAEMLQNKALSPQIFAKYNQGKLGILYLAGDNVLPLKKLINALKCASYLGIKTYLTIYLAKSVDERLLKKFNETLGAELSAEHNFIFEESARKEAELYCFLTLNATLEFVKKQEQNSKKGEEFALKLSPEHATVLENESYLQKGAVGGFLENCDFLLTEKTELPFSNIIALEHGGFIATENGGGYSFFGNSRENKLNDFANDPVLDTPTEFIFAGSKQFYRINCGASATRYTPGKITYYNIYPNMRARVEGYLLKNGKIKIWEVNLASLAGSEKNCKILYALRPALDWKRDKNNLIFTSEEGLLMILNLKTGTKAYAKILSNTLLGVKIAEQTAHTPYLFAEFVGSDCCAYIAVSDSKNDILSLMLGDIAQQKQETQQYFEALNPVKLKTKNLALDILFNRWLMPQIVCSRLNARAGYYQAGGAIGFRDQLQDVLSLLNFYPERVRAQIILAAGHQYLEGDVQHWWHPPRFGIRTKISDDKLFLVLVCAKYLRYTGDKGILAEKISYLISEPLREREQSRFEYPKESTEREPLLKHCLKALKNALRYGEHNLLLMGSGDWNDGMDGVGQKMKGESVVTSMLFVWAAREFADFVEDSAVRLELLQIADRLKDAINHHAFRNGQYLRLFSDDGKWYGAGEGALKVDLVSESLAVLSKTADQNRAISALSSAAVLVDNENSLIRLLAPSLGKNCYLGYISKYPKGVRENGGQYTHGAIWYLMALASVGLANEAFTLFCSINPVQKYQNEGVFAKYKGEPFVLSGDVYSSKRSAGRMGWSWYTGSAGWCYTFILEGLFGVKRLGNELEIVPNLPDVLNGSELNYCYKNSEYHIKFNKTGVPKLVYQGVELQTENRIPLQENRKVEIVVEY